MNTQEIKQRIQLVADNKKADEQALYNLKTERAKLYIENENNPKLRELDKEIATLIAKIDNTPAVITELENQLNVAQQNDSHLAKEKLIEEQQAIARQIAELSERFIESLVTANEINEQLRAAVSAECGLRQKTGIDVLESFCNPSEGSLPMLLESCEAQMSGQSGSIAGEAGKNIQIRL